MIVDDLGDFLNTVQLSGNGGWQAGPGGEFFSGILRQATRRGQDVLGLAESAVPILEELRGLTRDLRSSERGLLLRGASIFFMVVILRWFLIMGVNDSIWLNWLVVDKLALCMGAVFVFVGAAFLFDYVRNGPEWQNLDARLKAWFASYMNLDCQCTEDLGLSARLREIRMAELRCGLDGLPLRRRIYLGYIRALCMTFRRKRDKWPYLLLAVDMALFTIGVGGALVVPFIAWLESAALNS